MSGIAMDRNISFRSQKPSPGFDTEALFPESSSDEGAKCELRESNKQTVGEGATALSLEKSHIRLREAKHEEGGGAGGRRNPLVQSRQRTVWQSQSNSREGGLQAAMLSANQLNLQSALISKEQANGGLRLFSAEANLGNSLENAQLRISAVETHIKGGGVSLHLDSLSADLSPDSIKTSLAGAQLRLGKEDSFAFVDARVGERSSGISVHDVNGDGKGELCYSVGLNGLSSATSVNFQLGACVAFEGETIQSLVSSEGVALGDKSRGAGIEFKTTAHSLSGEARVLRQQIDNADGSVTTVDWLKTRAKLELGEAPKVSLAALSIDSENWSANVASAEAKLSGAGVRLKVQTGNIQTKGEYFRLSAQGPSLDIQSGKEVAINLGEVVAELGTRANHLKLGLNSKTIDLNFDPKQSDVDRDGRAEWCGDVTVRHVKVGGCIEPQTALEVAQESVVEVGKAYRHLWNESREWLNEI